MSENTTNSGIDLGVKVGSEAEQLWTKVKEEAEMLIKNHEQSLIIQKAMLNLAEQKIKKEQDKFK